MATERSLTVIVTGGRAYNDPVSLGRALDDLKPSLVVQGGAWGADALAVQWALQNDIPVETVEANWNKFGRAAGPIRNEQMLGKYPDATVLACEGGRGTADCVRQAKDRGMTIVLVPATQ